MKKFIALLLVVTLAFTSVFAGGASESSSDGKTTLTWALWDVTSTAYYQPLIDAYEAKNPDIKIEMLDLGSSDYSTMLQTQLSGGDDEIDIVTIKDIPGYNNNVKANLLTDLTDKIKADGIDTSAYGGIVEQITVNGKVYALPFRSDFWVIFYNKALFDEVGVPYPTNDMTFEEYDALARAVTHGSGAKKVYGAHYHTWRSAVQLFDILDGKHSIVDGGDYTYMTPSYTMVLNQQKDGICMDYATLKTSSTHYSGVFYNNSVATMNMGSWFIATLIKQVADGNADCTDWGIVKYPHAEGVEPGSTLGTITSLAVSRASKNQDAAWDFVKFVTGEEGAAVLASTGTFPAIQTEATAPAIAAIPGFPQDEASIEALNVSNLYLEMPLHEKSAEIEVVLNQVHDEIMTRNISLQDGLVKMGAQVDRVLAN